ncbi:hypothetical protein [Ochrobactrum sp. Marseille-Q0166]|uniref:hypothetical protein n=1 Tax=Ochrobactrum sp. Marseille-Q0166 TaxID=2761105 RepID=UPI00165511E6|nr:hypothetical protein [Ochrobactrum sp. Marseille-Q0166]MBC8717962.1 hypothetical protein [Ochrobactrum sp. Marseille-Q0166]
MTDKTTLPDLNGILPSRAIKIKKHGLAHRLLYPFLSIVFIFASIGVAVAWFPGLYKDHLIMNDPVVLEDASVNDGQCRSKKMTVNCKAVIVYDYDGERRVKPVEFSFVSLSSGDYETDVVMQRSDPENVTLTLAIDEFWNRLAFDLGLFAIMLAMAVLFLVRFIRIMGSASAMKSTAALRFAWAKITASKKHLGATNVTYNPLDATHKKKNIVSRFSKNEAPFMRYVEAEDETYGIVAIHPQASLPVLLDENFERLELSSVERETALKGVNAKIAG